MAKKSKIIGAELVLTAKAIRRGEKLERTLTKLAVVQETGAAAEAFLKAVQKGLERLRKDESPTQCDDKRGKKKAADGAGVSKTKARRFKVPRYWLRATTSCPG